MRTTASPCGALTLVATVKPSDPLNTNWAWTPDDSQFNQIRATGTAVRGNDPNAPPGLYVAIQEELGLKLEPVKALADVLFVDHVEKPSPN